MEQSGQSNFRARQPGRVRAGRNPLGVRLSARRATIFPLSTPGLVPLSAKLSGPGFTLTVMARLDRAIRISTDLDQMARSSPRVSGSISLYKPHGIDSTEPRSCDSESRHQERVDAMGHQNTVFHQLL